MSFNELQKALYVNEFLQRFNTLNQRCLPSGSLFGSYIDDPYETFKFHVELMGKLNSKGLETLVFKSLMMLYRNKQCRENQSLRKFQTKYNVQTSDQS